METPALFRQAPHLQTIEKISWVSLIAAPTPVHPFFGALEGVGHQRLFIKREDATDSRYGGNKVRNLEFLLGTARAAGANRLVTVAPYGSNFVAALAAQAKRLGMRSEVYHFVPNLSPQMHAHAEFSAKAGAQLHLQKGGRYLGLLGAQLRLQASRAQGKGSYVLPPGGSNAVGVLGHINAVFELQCQIAKREIPEPDLLLVGVGTCGTMAGLLAGLKLTGLKTRVIGVRCVDPVICNAWHVSYLANRALKLLRARVRVRVTEVDIRDGETSPYGRPLADAEDIIREVRRRSGVHLDTTYTTKVFSYLRGMAAEGKLRGQDVLYWNTYSPAAMAETETGAGYHRPVLGSLKVLAGCAEC